tara:strand:+ start:339 stop:821 length:483 start_codon:yes stop_codon:yes gene_type:complete
MNNNNQTPLQPLLIYIKKHFYTTADDPTFYRDRRMLLYAITWPATWFEQKAIPLTPEQYNHFILKKLKDIRKYGTPESYQQYFPRYLLKTLQGHLNRNHDALYQEYKHIRSQMNRIETLIQNLNTKDPKQSYTAILQQAHNLTKPKKPSKQTDPRQMTLF